MFRHSDHRIARAREYVMRDLTKRVTLIEAASVACLEPLYFSKRFRLAVGMTFVSWSASIRVAAAKKLLESPALSVSAIAAAVGYRDLTTFERAFKKVESICPREYRRCLDQSLAANGQEMPKTGQETPRRITRRSLKR
jgi:transcriptional regulator GlxA family with amidase domain